MKKKILGLVAVTVLLTGCGKVAKLDNGEDAVVSFNDGHKISVNELYNEMKDSYALSIIVKMIDKYVLETSFPDYIESAKEYAKNYVASLKSQYGEDELLQDLQNYGMSSLKEYEDVMYLSYMQSYAGSEYTKTLVTDKEINNYYKNEVVGDVEISHILITPNATDKMSEEEIKDAEAKALKKAEDLLKEIQNAGNKEEKFAEIAKENSNDEATKANGGSLGRINKTDLSDAYKDVVEAAYSIKDGSVYSKVVKSELGYHLVFKKASYEKDSLENVKDKIIETLAEEKFSKDTETNSLNALAYYRKKLGLNIEDDELNSQYSNYMANLLTSVTQK